MRSLKDFVRGHLQLRGRQPDYADKTGDAGEDPYILRPWRTEIEMTMPHERTRAVVQTHDFLLELSRDMSLPERIRRDANYLLRHYPSKEDVFLAGRIEEQSEKWPVGVLGPVFSSSLTFK
ncbi:BPSL0761 family protein [Pseudomonas aeruginosa]|uniref:BPSL0761 family protein n=3 Tax=Pseudomonas TaxID=286 RepID=UPI00281275EB|nr:BPSL0761 family protein [Pseudomonas aeruginosa]MDV8088433.1 BPSL0761 family protein [Pseudomonas aeruginosa]MDY1361321.1 BPSL0761 family protein [Pseudomonas aeruginosa]MDY1568985.1 BPSL0761 family protein [Pseudomonas aeruginosa]WMR51410.1 BPSL0761 family protein [Pseudomonas aeruginosa]